jgi:hypothetical protein
MKLSKEEDMYRILVIEVRISQWLRRDIIILRGDGLLKEQIHGIIIQKIAC